ncbi:MAG TPA: hypothetical protein DIT43_00805 [Dehalococcoidia bacterium]|nr:hypothetical protein [Dehalococcoidia bacterium]
MRLATAVCLFFCLFSAGCASDSNFDYRLDSIVKPYSFSIMGWELENISGGIGQSSQDSEVGVTGGPEQVEQYFSLVEQIKALEAEIRAITDSGEEDGLASLEAELGGLERQKAALRGVVEAVLAGQIREVLSGQGISKFPPLDFKLDKPPRLLVVSPRDRIESIREICLHQELSLEEIEEIEARVDELGVSSLVLEIGGLGATYPSFVADDASLRFTVDTVAEEWLHQYLVFRPLGFRYLLDLTGISRDYEIATMNETVASMVSKEIGAIVYEKYYFQDETGGDSQPPAGPEFDFNREMREIRRAVDRYLVRGEVEEAEEFMELKREYLVSEGYRIRKLNQAYFAFHGTYADSPTSVSPIGLEMKELRSRRASLKDFLDVAAGMTCRQDLIASLE